MAISPAPKAIRKNIQRGILRSFPDFEPSIFEDWKIESVAMALNDAAGFACPASGWASLITDLSIPSRLNENSDSPGIQFLSLQA